MAEIYSLVYKPEDENAADHYTRLVRRHVHLVVGRGIAGDLSGSGNPDRQLNIMSYETQANLQTQGFKAQPGALGEQISVRGLDVNLLPAGTRVQLGESAVIEVVKPRTGCDRFEAIQGQPRTNAAGQLGVLARVVAEGVIRIGDPVKVLETIPE